MNVAGRYRFPAAVQLDDGQLCHGGHMAKLTRSNAVSALAECQSAFSPGTGRFTIGVTGRDGTTYHLHLTAPKARQFVTCPSACRCPRWQGMVCSKCGNKNSRDLYPIWARPNARVGAAGH
jgi:hypothetical protein